MVIDPLLGTSPDQPSPSVSSAELRPPLAASPLQSSTPVSSVGLRPPVTPLPLLRPLPPISSVGPRPLAATSPNQPTPRTSSVRLHPPASSSPNQASPPPSFVAIPVVHVPSPLAALTHQSPPRASSVRFRPPAATSFHRPSPPPVVPERRNGRTGTEERKNSRATAPIWHSFFATAPIWPSTEPHASFRGAPPRRRFVPANAKRLSYIFTNQAHLGDCAFEKSSNCTFSNLDRRFKFKVVNGNRRFQRHLQNYLQVGSRNKSKKAKTFVPLFLKEYYGHLK